MYNKTTATVLMCFLLASSSVFAAPQDSRPLSEVQTQAKEDLATLQNNYQIPTDKLFTELPALFPWILMRKSDVASLQKRLIQAEKQADAAEERAVAAELRTHRAEKWLTILQDEAKTLHNEIIFQRIENETTRSNMLHLAEFSELNKFQRTNAYKNLIDVSSAAETKFTWEMEQILNAMEKGDKDTFDWFIKFLKGNPKGRFVNSRTGATFSRIANEMFQDYQRNGYSKNMIEGTLVKLDELLCSKPIMHRYAGNLSRALSKTLLTRAGLLSGGLLLISGLTAHAQPLHSTMAERLHQNFKLFLEATPEELREIEQDSEASQACRDMAQAISFAAHSEDEATQAILSQTSANHRRAQQAKQEINLSLRRHSALAH